MVSQWGSVATGQNAQETGWTGGRVRAREYLIWIVNKIRDRSEAGSKW